VVSGRLQIRNWTDKDGNKRRSAEVVADNVYFGDSKKDSSSGAAPATGVAAYEQQEFTDISDEPDSDLPF
jgi:single-strand DNA-binding protein